MKSDFQKRYNTLCQEELFTWQVFSTREIVKTKHAIAQIEMREIFVAKAAL